MNTKLYCWTILAFRKLENKDVSYANYLYYSWSDSVEGLKESIADTMLVKFPVADGWFEHHYLIEEISA